jgi:hypothetical protein
MATLAPVMISLALRRAAAPLLRAVVITGTAAGAILLAASAASARNGYEEAGDPGAGLSVVETLLLYVAAPAAIFALIALVVVGPSIGKGPRHRTGAALETGPVWIDSTGAQHTPAATVRPEVAGGKDQGGASAHW